VTNLTDIIIQILYIKNYLFLHFGDIMNKAVAIFLTLLVLINVSLAQNKKRIAVLNLQVHGLSGHESATLTDRLRGEMVKTGSFTILERGEMDEILKEQGFQLTGCTTDECAVEAGQLLNVQYICAGSIGKVGSLYTVTTRLIDVESGEIIKTVTEDCNCPIERVLTTSMRNIALKLAGRIIEDKGETVYLSKGNGDLYIKTDPPGARIFLDNLDTKKESPATLENIAAGKHYIKVIKGNYIATASIIVKANNIVEESIPLQRALGNLKVYSTPLEAEIIIDGESYGRTPRIIKKLTVGEHKVVIKKDFYQPYTEKININYQQLSQIKADLNKLAQININSHPSGAVVSINGIEKGRTPLKLALAPFKDVKIKIHKEYFQEWFKTYNLSAGEAKTINPKLRKNRGILDFSNLLQDSKIVINNRKVKLKSSELPLPFGKYDIEISKKGFVSKNIVITLQSKREVPIEAGLQRKTAMEALTRSLIVPGWGQFYQAKYKRSWIYPLAVISSITGSYFYNNTFNEAVNDYDMIRANYLNSTSDNEIEKWREKMYKKYDDVKFYKKTRNIFYFTTTAIWLWNVLDTIILPAGWENKVDISAGSEKNIIKAGLSFRW